MLNPVNRFEGTIVSYSKITGLIEITNTTTQAKTTLNATIDNQSNWIANFSTATVGNYSIVAKATPVQGSVTSSTAITVSVITGLEADIVTNSFVVSPNPSTSNFNLTLTHSSNVELDVYNMMGTLVESASTSANALSFGANLSAGVYFVKATVNGNNEFFKVVKK